MEIPIQEFKTYLKDIRKLSDRTIKEYSNYLEIFSVYSKFNQDAVDMFMHKYNQSVGRSFIRILRNYLTRNPELIKTLNLNSEEIYRVELPKTTGRKEIKIPNILSESDIHKIEQVFEEERYKLLLLLNYYCGLRIQELTSITIDKVRFDKWVNDTSKYGEIIVYGKGSKEGIALVPGWLMLRLYNWIKERNFNYGDNLFKVRSFEWSKIIKKAGLIALNRNDIHSHLCRHSRASNLLNSGANLIEIKDVLRHSDISSTQIYTHISKDNLSNRIQELDNKIKV